MELAEAAALADEYAARGLEKELANLRTEWDDESRPPRAIPTTASGPSRSARSHSSASGTLELIRRGPRGREGLRCAARRYPLEGSRATIP